jgi:hypothetical protein
MRLDRYLPGDAADARDLAAVVLGAVGVALALILARRRALLTTGRVAALVAAVALLVPLQAQYAIAKYVDGAGAKSGPSDRTRAFADTLVPGGQPIGEFLEGAGKDPWYFPIWQEVQFYNQRIDRVFSLGPNVNPVPPGDELYNSLSFDPRTGRLSVPLPDYVVIPSIVGNARLRGQLVYASAYTPVELIRVEQPARLAWSAKGFDSTGQLADGAAADVRFYGPGTRCATFTLLAPPDRPTKWRIDGPGQAGRSGTIAAGKVGRATVPLADLAARGFLDVRLGGEAVHVVDISVGATC